MSRRESVSQERFVVAYLNAHKAGLTMQQLADSLGMEKASASVKASQVRKDLEAYGKTLPKLKQMRAKKDLGVLARMVTDYEASLSDMDGNANVTISDHLDEDVPFDDTDPQEEGNDGRTLIGSI